MRGDTSANVDRADHKDGSAAAPARSSRSLADLAATLAEFIAKSPNVLGNADIVNINSFHAHERAGVLAAVLTGLRTIADNKPAVNHIIVVTGPGTDIDRAHAEVWSALLQGVQMLSGREIPDDARAWFNARLKVMVAPDFNTQSLMHRISEQPEHTAIIVTDSAKYRDESVEPFIVPGAAGPLLPQDIWVPQVHVLATDAVKLAREGMQYIAIDTGQLSPTRNALQDLILSIDGCGVLGSSNDHDLASILTERVGLWDQWIREGYLGRTLRDIQELPVAFDTNKRFLRIQMLHKAGCTNEALEAIREELTRGRTMEATARVKLAKIAEDANASTLAAEILDPAIDELESLEDLESALKTASESGPPQLEERAASRLSTLFPNSAGLRARKRRMMTRVRDYRGIAETSGREGDHVNATFFGGLAQFLSVNGTPDYLALIASAGTDAALADAFRMACVEDALQRHLVVHAFQLVLPIPESPAQSKSGERLLVRVLEAAFLSSRNGVRPLSDEDLEAAVVAIIDRLALDPANQRLRVDLAGLIQPSVSGHTGLALMAAIVLRLGSRPLEAPKAKTLASVQADWILERKDFISATMRWLEEQQPVIIGRLTMPAELMTEPADEVISAVTQYLNHAPVADEGDVQALRLWLTFAASVTPHCSDPDRDLTLMRIVGTKLASSGYTQVARDLAEQALLNSKGFSPRRRLAWFAMADIYHRCHNYLEGLIALACAFAADDSVDEEEAWYEINALVRFLRDCWLHTLARDAIVHARQHLVRMKLDDRHNHRLDTLELQIRQRELIVEKADKAELERLVVDAVRNGEVILEEQDETAPIAMVLGQLINLARRIGAIIPSNSGVVWEKLCERAGGNLALFARVASADLISTGDLLNLAKVRGSARYSFDVGYDMRDVALVASRALSDSRFTRDAVATSFALELLADQGVATPGWDEAAKPPSAPERVEQAAEIACAVSQEGLSVVQMGLDSNGRLVRLSAIGGQLQATVHEPYQIFNEDRFNAWAGDFPYRYGIDESSPNLFYTTTADLRMSELPDGPVVIAADANLQAFPPNIFFLGDDFSGRTRPMAATPSLGWLNAARQMGTMGDGRLCAWISTAVSGGGSDTLTMLADRLTPTLGQFGFLVDNGPTLPESFEGVTMAVVAAHGSIHDDGRFFKVVSDEGILRVTTDDLAAALRNVGIVVLFVCSGGRADKHPTAHTTLGLARQILDRGCQAVIASPWPLDSRVPSHWLPVFLDQWSKGAPLIQANFAANRVVDNYFALDPARGLAMSLFGNPLFRRERSHW